MVLQSLMVKLLSFLLLLVLFGLSPVHSEVSPGAMSIPDSGSGYEAVPQSHLESQSQIASVPRDESESESEVDDDYYEFIEEWHRNRIEILKSEQGWLRLVGLHWLNEGEQSFGSSDRVRIRFPEGSIPEFAGIFKLKADTVIMQVAGNIDIRDQRGRRMRDDVIYTPDLRHELRYRSLTWFVVRRDDEFGIRLFDDNSPYLTHFNGIERYDVDSNWRIEADFTPGDEGASMKIENVLGQLVDWELAGTLTFSFDDGDVEILALGTSDRLFIPFADATSGSETYTLGRYVYIDRPEPGEPAIIDFNVSYNPPCAINPYTSCPLPPQENRLDFPIRAGEKNYKMYSEED